MSNRHNACSVPGSVALEQSAAFLDRAGLTRAHLRGTLASGKRGASSPAVPASATLPHARGNRAMRTHMAADKGLCANKGRPHGGEKGDEKQSFGDPPAAGLLSSGAEC